ncbi:MAG: glycoside hydrolase family 66 protein [Firmicutes bacterium]|jgi:dextranase|nr:glycoside hydrolase family 66 protein [Bacillota bacterium]
MVQAKSLHFDKAQYRPGEDVWVEVHLGDEIRGTGTDQQTTSPQQLGTTGRAGAAGQAGAVRMSVVDIVSSVYSASVAVSDVSSIASNGFGRAIWLRIPGDVLEDRLLATGRLGKAVGFGLEIEIEAAGCENGRMRASAGFDIAPHWRCAPRYGFVCEFGPRNHDTEPGGRAGRGRIQDEPGEDKWQAMTDMHLNVVQFYDWMYRHHDFMPPEDVFIDPLGRLLDLREVRAQVVRARDRRMAPMAYGAMYGAERDFVESHPGCVAYRMDGTPHSLGDLIFVMDISRGSEWSRHIIEEYSKAINEVGFDGVHVDQYGFPKTYYTKERRLIRTEDEFAPFIETCRARLGPDVGLIFNCVNNWPVSRVALAPQDAVYIEVWPPHDTYRDLRALVLRGLEAARHKKQVILAAYVKPFQGEEIRHGLDAWTPAETAMRLTSAAIMASGGFHLVLGEGDAVLTDGYYPRYARIRPEFAGIMRRYWDFAVRYEEFLFDLGARDVSETEVGGADDTVQIVNLPSGPWGDAGKVWATVRHGEGYELLNLVNLVGVDSPAWNEPKASPPTPLRGVAVRWLMDEQIRDVLHASPDRPDLSLVRLPYREVPHTHGRAIEFVLPELDYWGMVLVRVCG